MRDAPRGPWLGLALAGMAIQVLAAIVMAGAVRDENGLVCCAALVVGSAGFAGLVVGLAGVGRFVWLVYAMAAVACGGAVVVMLVGEGTVRGGAGLVLLGGLVVLVSGVVVLAGVLRVGVGLTIVAMLMLTIAAGFASRRGDALVEHDVAGSMGRAALFVGLPVMVTGLLLIIAGNRARRDGESSRPRAGVA